MKRFWIRLMGGFLLVFMTCMVTFFLFKALPGDAYADQLYQSYVSGGTKTSAELQWREYVSENKLDLPQFYFSILPTYVDARASRIPLQSQFKKYVRAASHYKPREDFYNIWTGLSQQNLSEEKINQLRSGLTTGISIDSIRNIMPTNPVQKRSLSPFITDLQMSNDGFTLPAFYWHGSGNQFHFWMERFFTGKLKSEQLNQSVFSAIWNALLWTLSINIPAFLCLLLVGGILGGAKSLSNNSLITAIETIFYIFYSMPLFWLCILALTMAISLLPEGSFQLLIGPFDPEELSIYTIYRDHFSSIYIPIFCILIHSAIYISRHVEQSIDSVKQKRYVIASRARGLSDKLILRKHIIPASVRPIITLIPQLLPGLIAGSVIVELIFNIPGMGRLFWNSLLSRDWQMVLSLVIFISTVVYICMWLADVLYPENEKIDSYA